MKKTLIILVLLLVGFSNVSNAMSDEEYLLQNKTKIESFLSDSELKTVNKWNEVKSCKFP